jgi:AraC-like DNA-binding protein
MLQRADRSTTVLGIALKCNFQNQGHFARDYRLAFGERPSDTMELARRRAPPGGRQAIHRPTEQPVATPRGASTPRSGRLGAR